MEISAKFAERVTERLMAGILTFPDGQTWVIVVILIMIYGLIALPIGLRNGFLQLDQNLLPIEQSPLSSFSKETDHNTRLSPLFRETDVSAVNVKTSWHPVLKILITALFTPAILEEIFFRVLLLPHPSENPSLISIYAWSTVSLFIFVIYHPLNAITFYPAARETFFKPMFLFLATLLGIICTIAYLQSGSIWTAVFIHWLFVVIWLIGLGGKKRLL
ncbi:MULTISPECIES: CPBP family glutamic-type intramembrane protease [unclassified Moorena]|uniref:CPBP family glutamic-type intramembrane protease n=1 Tax=unclassified Moorena TaxID=2683338 RepID=UPI0014014B69|nr:MULTISPECIES: CPBP family glutamic-type intramembrane protease [unclassified Moorena]NEO12443.1 CPBP family intramembrane metalloprotease [Moorena sp. SIO3E8]NEP99292.1 CPBP family intramembrane metalloprotease [Moorena sp. SIO3F7]